MCLDACKKGQVEIVIELISEGADVNQLDEVRVVSQQSLGLVHVYYNRLHNTRLKMVTLIVLFSLHVTVWVP